MDISLIIYIVIFLAVIVLLFKLIKKVIFAVFASLFLVVLLFAGIGGMVYMDYKDISTKDNFNLNIVYGDFENGLNFGLSIPIENKSEFSVDKLEEISIKSLDEKSLEKEKDDIYLLISENFLKTIMKQNSSYYLIGTKDLQVMTNKVDAKLSREDVLDILESKDAQEEYMELIFDKNEFLVENELVKKMFESELEKQLNTISLKSALFASILKDLEAENTIDFIDGIKDEEILVYPKKFSIKVIKYIPTSFLKGLFEDDK